MDVRTLTNRQLQKLADDGRTEDIRLAADEELATREAISRMRNTRRAAFSMPYQLDNDRRTR